MILEEARILHLVRRIVVFAYPMDYASQHEKNLIINN
jgi:hypothetical protein